MSNKQLLVKMNTSQ